MRIAFNPTSAAPLTQAPSGDYLKAITFDLAGHNIFTRGEIFKGTDTTYEVFRKATQSAVGYNGLVPAPSYNSGSTVRFLREDGNWLIPNQRSISIGGETILNIQDINKSLDINSGNGIRIEAETDTNGNYTGKITVNTTFEIDPGEFDGTLADAFTSVKVGAAILKASVNKQLSLNAGTGITLSPNTTLNTIQIAAPIFTGATNSTAGKEGIVPAPTTSNTISYLRGDGNWVNLTTDQIIGLTNYVYNYTITSTPVNLATTDTLNQALAKLEHKANQGVYAYNWVISVTTEDTDQYINKWQEIVDFLNKVDDTNGADITDEFVTRKTNQDVTGKKTFINSDGTYFRWGNNGVRLIGSGDYGYLQLGQIAGDGTKTHKGKITGISAQTLTSLDIAAQASTFSGTVIANKFVSGNGVNDFSAGTVKLDVLNIPTSSGGTTFGPGSNGQVLKSNGTTVYWANDNNSNTWRNIKVNGTQIAGTGTDTYSVDYLSGDGISVTGVAGTSTTKNNTITITNAGVRSVTIGTGDNVNKLAVNTNGTTNYLTIPYATTASQLKNTSVSNPAEAASEQYLKWYSQISQASGYAGNNYGFPVSNNANGILWMGTHSGPYGGQLGVSSNGRLYYRFISNNTFPTTANGGSWNKIAWTSDIPNLSVSTSGSGNAVTDITVSGHAITVTKGSTFSTSGHTHYYLATPGDQRSTATTPNSYSNKFIFQGLKTNSTIGSPSSDTYSYLVGLRGWSDSSGGNSWELAFNNTGMYARNGATTSWGSWKKVAFTSDIPSVTVSTTGSGNAITSVSASGHAITFTKGTTFSVSGHTHDDRYVNVTGDTMTGTLNTAGTKGTWVSGMTSAAIQFNSLTAIDSNSFWKLFNMKSSGSHVVCYGGLGNNIGFYGYYSGRTENSHDWNFVANTANGNWTATASIYAAHFYENSDIQLKTNIQEILRSDNIPTIKEFDWKEDGSHSYGLIAQELEEQGYPELVSIKDDGYKTVNYSAALSLIVGKLQVKIKELEKEIKILKNKN